MNEQDWAYLIAALCAGTFLSWVAWAWAHHPPPAAWLRDEQLRRKRLNP